MAQLNAAKKEETPPFDFDAEIEAQKQEVRSNIFTGISGNDDTCKTGIAFGIRTKEDIEAGKDVYVLDLEVTAYPIKKFWGNDPHIICLNPTVFYTSGEHVGEKDATKTLEKLRNYIMNIKERKNVAGVIVDDLGSLLKLSEVSMKLDNLNIDIYASGKEMGDASKRGEIRRTDWSIRDRKYNTIIELLKNQPFPVIFTTHLKDVKKMIPNDDGIKELQVTGQAIDWGNYTSAACHQRISCEKFESKDDIKWTAKIDKSKSNPALTGKVFTIMTKNKKDDEYKWFGFDWNMFR